MTIEGNKMSKSRGNYITANEALKFADADFYRYYIASKLSNDKKLSGQAFNFGPPLKSNYKVLDIVKEIKKNWHLLRWQSSNKKFKESNLLKLNSNKSLKLLNWKNKLRFKDTIKLVTDWYKCLYEKKDVHDFSINQIKFFLKKK